MSSWHAAKLVKHRDNYTLFILHLHRLKVLRNRLLRRIFGPKRYEIISSLRKLHNEELHDLYSSPNITRTMKSRYM
jgi:hypothetical protein